MKENTKTTSSRFQFFVRWNSNSLVIHASRKDTVELLLKKLSSKTKIPIKELRLIYKGKQLQVEQNLGECGIENDETLQLLGYLRSTQCPQLWGATEFIASLILKLCRELYMSPNASNKSVADLLIKEFVQICLDLKCKEVQVFYLEALLQFCELLREVGCKCDDLLYVFCRNGFATLLANVGGVTAFRNYSKWRVLFHGIFFCVCETLEVLLSYLDLSMSYPTSEGLSCSVVWAFVKFSTPLRNGIAEKQPAFGEYENGICYEEDPSIAGVVDQFRNVFIQLLTKMDECFQVMENCLVNKEQREGGGDVIHNGQSHYLLILKELYHISKLYSGAEVMFWGVLLRRKSVLSQLIVRFADKKDNHRWVLENMCVTDFESRRHLAMTLFPDLRHELLGYEMLIGRSDVLAESFEYISRAKPTSLEGGLFMAFKNEVATGPGVLREWFVLFDPKRPRQQIRQSRIDQSPKQCMFPLTSVLPARKGHTPPSRPPTSSLLVLLDLPPLPGFCWNHFQSVGPRFEVCFRASKVHPLHLKYFSFSGRMIALALKSKVQVGIYFDRVFFKQLAGNYITLEDIRDADPIMYRSCKQILEMNADYIDSDELGLTFSIEVEELGHRKVIELCPGGESLVVGSKNREKYVDLLIQNRFVTSISRQVSHFAAGFADIISGSRLEFFRYLELEDLDWMLHGSENAISVEDWKAHTKYNGYKENDRRITWFWEIVGRMSAEQKKVLLFFWTSVKHLPVEGFRGLGSRLFICKSSKSDNHLPSSHTCFYELCFPKYSSRAIMQDRLRIITQEHMSCSFGTL
ncbi:E3 ubiquitin-protein ligase upl5-like protein [Trifolium pratense]|uniref:HECT-type E3 ubiquitin transferase n=1 Tax=Trifolium pratense TaxID=57577 RepID=A0A2K3P4F2_TRIPR|nr:E3 ubiquitin-protein ligase upl5-like protein [Trifolium pratense]